MVFGGKLLRLQGTYSVTRITDKPYRVADCTAARMHCSTSR